MTTSRITTRAGLSGAIAALALVGCVGLVLPFERGLFAQAALIAALLGVLVLSGLSGARAWLREVPWTLKVGLGMYAAAAAFGCAVGLLSASPLRFVASQAIAMALLPLSAIAFGIQPRFLGRELANGLSVAVLVGVGVHLCALFVPYLAGQSPSMGRLALRYGTSFSAVALVTLLVAGAHAAASERTRLNGVEALAALGLLIMGMSRGAWVSAVLGVVVALLIGTGLRGRRTAMLLATGAAALAAAAAFAVWGAAGGDLLIDGVDPSGLSGGPAGTGRAPTATLTPRRAPGRSGSLGALRRSRPWRFVAGSRVLQENELAVADRQRPRGTEAGFPRRTGCRRERRSGDGPLGASAPRAWPRSSWRSWVARGRGPWRISPCTASGRPQGRLPDTSTTASRRSAIWQPARPRLAPSPTASTSGGR